MKFRTAILGAYLCLGASSAFGQACAMCYSSASATSREGQRAIGKGVIVLMVPTTGLVTLGLWSAFRYGRKRDLENC
jgi:hypothetical protein